MQFVVAGLFTAAVLALVSGWFSRKAAEQEAVDQAVSTNELLARAVIQPALTTGLMTHGAADIDRLDRLMRARIEGTDTLRVKLWNDEGVILYSDEPRLIGQQFPLDAEKLAVLKTHQSFGQLSTLTSPENRFERPLGRVLEVYTEVTGPSGEPLLFEVYYDDSAVTERTGEIVRAFEPVTVGGILLFLLLTVPLVLLLARRLSAAAAARERLLVMAAGASDAERRRIAQDIHDGVVQDLVGTSFALSGTERELSGPSTLSTDELQRRLHTMASSLRSSMKSLRSLLVEIYPPNLSRDGLASALDDLLAPAVASGVDVQVDLPKTRAVPEDVLALVWRTAQESVRNAMRHGEPQHLGVRLTAPNENETVWVLEVSDDGRGFDPRSSAQSGHFGLRGLRDLAREAGGDLVIESSPGNGTTITLTVAAR